MERVTQRLPKLIQGIFDHVRVERSQCSRSPNGRKYRIPEAAKEDHYGNGEDRETKVDEEHRSTPSASSQDVAQMAGWRPKPTSEP